MLLVGEPLSPPLLPPLSLPPLSLPPLPPSLLLLLLPLLPLLLLPLLVPLLIAATRATDDLLAGAATPVSAPWWELMAGLCALFLGGSVLLFESLVEE